MRTPTATILAFTLATLLLLFQNCSPGPLKAISLDSASFSAKDLSSGIVPFTLPDPTRVIIPPPVSDPVDPSVDPSEPPVDPTGGSLDLRTDSALQAAPNSPATSYLVHEYWPRPEAGRARINEFSYLDNSGQHILFQIQRYKRDPNNRYFHLEDYLVSHVEKKAVLTWADTWVLTIDPTTGVQEVQDFFPTGITHQAENPLNHGQRLYRGQEFVNLANGHIFDSTGTTQIGFFWNQFWILFETLKTEIKLPGGTFKDVVSQVEQQTGESNGDGQRTVHRYRFYFAKDHGIIAMQYFNDLWQPGVHPLLYLTKTCSVDASLFRCP